MSKVDEGKLIELRFNHHRPLHVLQDDQEVSFFGHCEIVPLNVAHFLSEFLKLVGEKLASCTIESKLTCDGDG